MRTTLTFSTALGAALLLAVGACGGDDDATPDAMVDDSPDAEPAPDAGPSCTALTTEAQDIGGTDDNFAFWVAPVTTTLTGADSVSMQMEFYGGIESSLAGTFDLAEGNQANYSTCAVCFRVFELDEAGEVIRQYFQSGGSVTLAADPSSAYVLDGDLTDLALVEVTIATDGSFVSTPVEGGQCLTLGSLVLDADDVPNAWTCALDAYNDGTSCDCECGTPDPDCDLEAPPVVGCEKGEVCRNDTCTETCDVLGAEGCTTGTCGFETADTDICYTDATLVDAAALGATCASADAFFCAVNATIATGMCDQFVAGDGVCREACDDNTDCEATEVCAAVVGAKGLCITPPANDTCQTATALTIGTPVNGSTAGGTSNYNAGLQTATCTGFSMPGDDVAYSVALTAGQAITVTLSNASANFDSAIAILGPGEAAAVCDANPVTCHAGADDGLGGDDETFMYTAGDAGTYYIIVDSYSASSAGTFTLTVTSP